ncbi:MAG: Flp pilus assembly protein TadD [Rhodothermales bacterium]|jgi:Flp pilus assembly protein TadD
MAKPRQSSKPQIALAWSHRTQLCLVALLPLLLYVNTLRHDFALDDVIVYRDNRFVQDGVSGIPSILSTDAFSGYSTRQTGLSGGRYRPLSMITFAIEHQLWGKRPGLSHSINALLYAANCLLIFLVLCRLLPASPIPLVATLLFAAHPIHTEVVANIKGRDELLCFAFVLLSFLSLKQRPVLAALAFLLAMFAKETAITFLAIFPLVAHLKGARLKESLKQVLPCVIAVLAFLAVRTAVVGFLGDRGTTNLLVDPFALSSTAERLATATWALGRYLGLLLFPHPLSCDYSTHHFSIRSWGDLSVLVCLVAHLAAVYWAICGVRKRKAYGLVLVYYFATMSIIANIVFPVGTILADRFLYMPSLAFCVGLAWFARFGRPAFIGLALVMLAYSAKTIHRNAAWHDNWTLIQADIQSCPNSARLQAMYGEQAWSRGMNDDAFASFTRSLEIYPDSSSVHRSIGLIHANRADYSKAIHHLSEALSRDPIDTTARYNLGLAYAVTGKHDDAIAHLRQFVEAKPSDAQGRLTLSQTLCGKGDWATALPHLRKAYELAPNIGTVRRDFGVCLYTVGEHEEARPLLEAHLKQVPGDKVVDDMLRRLK